LRSRIRTKFAYTTAETDTAEPHDVVNSDEEETELRLFATGPSTTGSTNKIRLSSPGAGSGEGGFIVKKPRSYYFADEPTSDEELRLEAAAIDGETILQLSSLPWPGCALPWKVRSISASGLKQEVLIGHPPRLVAVEEKEKKRTRKNKKTRIAIRKKIEATKNKGEEEARLAKEKEEAEREKRTRRNREKKVKKKAKAQAKKEGGDDGLQDELVHPDRRR
jgi:hypothetical protein